MTDIPRLPSGFRLTRLERHLDSRGTFTELYRQSWDAGIRPVQWNVVSSRAGVVRGVHTHVRHDDYLSVVAGRVLVGFRDLRRGSPTFQMTGTFPLGPENSVAVTIPRGVAHGFLFLEPSVHVYAVSEYFDPSDEFHCRYDDSLLGIPWPTLASELSEKDARAPGFEALVEALRPYQPFQA